ncbi:MAG: AsmA-like C-terminal region-containing protein, partial [Candidatus Eiseniibacteriota bacterium]
MLGTAPRIDATLGLNRLDLDKLLEPMVKRAAAAPAPAPAPAASVGSGAARPATPPVVVALPTLEMPRWPRIGLNLTVDALVYRREIIRNLRANGTLADGKLNLYGLAAQLPGSADLALSGTLTAVDRRPKFDGPLTLNAGNLRGVLDWLGIDASRVSAGRLRTFSVSGKLAIDPAAIRLVDAAMNLDVSRATGSIGLRLGAEPTALADLTVDRLDVGAYWPRPRPAPSAAAKADAATSGEAKTDGKDAPTPLPSWRGPVDAELQLAVGTLVADGHVLREARFRGVLAKDSLTVERATFQDYEGLKGGVTGTIRKLSQRPLLNLAFDLQAGELIDVVRLAGLVPPSTLAHAGPTLIRGTLKGEPDKLEVALRADAARGTLNVNGTVAPPMVNPHFDVGVEIKHPDASDLLPLLAGAVPPGVDLEGPAAFATHLKGDLGRIDFSDLHLLLNKTEVVGAGSIELARLRPRLVARFDSGPLTLDQLFALPAVLVADSSPGVRAPEKTGWSNEPLDLTGLARLDAELEIRPKVVSLGAYHLDDAEVRMTLADGALELSRVSGKLFGGDFVGKASAGGGKTPQLRAAFAVTKADLGALLSDGLKPAPVNGALDLEVDLETAGGSIQGLVAGLKGTARATARDGTIRGFDLARINSRIEDAHESVGLINLLQEGMSSGSTDFKALAGSFDIKGGVARTKDLKLEAKGGTGTASGSLDLSSRAIDATADFHLSAVPDAPPFRVMLTGAPGALRAIFQFNELQQYLLKRGKPG